jgi:hypothetical protein
MQTRWLGLASVGLLLLLAAGCGGRDPNLPELVMVSGTVTLDDKLVSDAVVWFIPTGSTRGKAAGGRTDQDGKYELHSSSGEIGTAAGEYRVTIEKMAGGGAADIPGVPPIAASNNQLLPPEYASRVQTPLTATVAEGGSVIDFELESPR